MNLKIRIEEAFDELNILVKNFDNAKSDKMNISINQLKVIMNELDKMKNVMNPKKFFPSYGHMIVDSWSNDEEIELSIELLKIESAYNILKT